MTGTPSTPTPNGTATAVNSTGGGGGFPGPVELVSGGFLWVVRGLVSGATALLGMVQDIIFGIYVPGTPGDIASWGPPETGLWVGAWALYWTLAPLGMALLVFQAMTAHGSPASNRDTTAKLAEIAKCGAMILAGWPIAIGGLHLAGRVSMAIAPAADTLLSTPGNVTKLGLGAVVGGALLILQASAAIVAVIVIFLEHVIVVAAVAGWPVWWGLRPAENGFANAASGIGLSMYLGVIGAKLAQASLAMLVLNADWGLGTAGGFESAALSVLGSAVALGMTFVGIPYVVGQNFVPEAMMMLGTPAVKVADEYAGQARGQAKDRAGEAASEYADSARARTPSMPSSASIPTPTWSRGSGSAAGAGVGAGEYNAGRAVPEDYQPDPGPGSAPPSPNAGASDGGGTSAEGGQQTTADRFRAHRDLIQTVSERQTEYHDNRRSV